MHPRFILATTATVLFVTLTLVITSRNNAQKSANAKATQNKTAAIDTMPSSDGPVRSDMSLRTSASPRASVQRPPFRGMTPWNAGEATEVDGSDQQRAFPSVSASKPTRKPRTSGSQVEFLADALFLQLDVNHDGVLSGSEIPTEFREAVNERGVIDAETFAKLFQDVVKKYRDGELTAASVNAPGMQSLTGALPGWFTALDPDGTGRVTLARWRAAGRKVAEFERMDTNSDGVLTWREVRAFQAQPGAGSGAIPGRPQAGQGGADSMTMASSSGQDGKSPDETKPAVPSSRADALLAYYGAVAAGTTPPRMRNLVVASAPPAKPAKPAKASAAPPSSSPGLPPTSAVNPAPPPPPATDAEVATLPLPISGTDYWDQRDSEHVTALDEGARPNVLFLGDSITDFLQNASGGPVWDEYFAPLSSLNFGVGGIRTSHVLWQIETGEVAMATPKVIVLLIGSNNLGIAKQEPEEVAAGIEKIVAELGEQLPDTRVLLLGILPRGPKPDDPFRAQIARVNSLISDLDDGNRVTFLDIGNVFLSKDGSISPDVMPDGAHPSLYGYELYTEAMLPTLKGLLPKNP
jgi:lysophospholipase L1-like esterase